MLYILAGTTRRDAIIDACDIANRLKTPVRFEWPFNDTNVSFVVVPGTLSDRAYEEHTKLLSLITGS